MLVILRTHRDVLERYQRALPIHPRRRISGHQQRPVSLAAPARRRSARTSAASATTTSRSIPGAAREVANILRFEKDFPGREDHPARAELPLHPAHPRRRVGRDRATIAAGSARRCGPSTTRARRSSVHRRVGRPRGSAPRRRGDRGAQRGGGSLDDIAILVRAQFQTREFEDRFIAIGLPYQHRRRLPLLRARRDPRRARLSARRRPARRRPRLRTDRQHRPSAASATRRWRRSTSSPAPSGMPLTHRRRAHPRHRRADRRRRAARSAISSATSRAGATWRRRSPHPELARLILDESGYTAMSRRSARPKPPGGSKTSPSWSARWRNMKRSAPSSNMSAW